MLIYFYRREDVTRSINLNPNLSFIKSIYSKNNLLIRYYEYKYIQIYIYIYIYIQRQKLFKRITYNKCTQSNINLININVVDICFRSGIVFKNVNFLFVNVPQPISQD